MDDLNELVLFAELARASSIAEVARRRGIPKSTVSRHLAHLEKQVGSRLLARTTRRIALTEVGEAFLKYCDRVAESAKDAKGFVETLGDAARGKLRVTMPGDVANYLLAGPIAGFLARYPDVQLEVDSTARRADLVGERYDIAIRVGPMPDSSLVAGRFVSVERALFASPSYLTGVSAPTRPEDLAGHKFLQLEALAASPPQIKLRHGNEERVVPLTIRVVANSLGFLRSLAIAGAGVAAIPTVMCVDEERRGDLVRLLPGWSPGAMESHYVIPSTKLLPVATRKFIEMLIGVHDEMKRSGQS